MGIETWVEPSGTFGMGAGPVSPIVNRALEGTLGAVAPSGIASVLGSVFGPISLIYSLGSFFKNRWDAEERENAARYNAALNTLLAAGINPFDVYSPDVINNLLVSPEGLDVIAGFYPGDIRSELEAGTATPDSISQRMAFDLISDAARNPSRYAQPFAGYATDVFDSAGQIWNDPSRILGVILGPGGVTGNIEWGGGTMKNVPGTSTAVYTGSPAPGVFTGVDTGNDVVNAAIRRVLGQTEGGETTTWDVILEGAAKASGLPVDEVAKILKDSGVNVPSPNAPSTGGTGGTGSTTTTATGGVTTTPDTTGGTYVGVGDNTLYDKILDWLRRNKDATDEEIRTAAETAGVTPGDIAGATGANAEEVQRRWDEAGGGGGLETVTGGGGLDTTPGGGGVLDTGGWQPDLSNVIDIGGNTPVITAETPKSDVNEPGVLDVVPPTTVLNVPSGGGGGGGGGGSPAYDALIPQYRTVTTTPADLARIDYLYDVGGESIFAPMRETQSEDDKRLARIRDLQRGSYAQGGPVDIVGLALQLLRG